MLNPKAVLVGLLRRLGGVIAAGCESFRGEVQQNLSALKDVAFRKIITPVITKKKRKESKYKSQR